MRIPLPTISAAKTIFALRGISLRRKGMVVLVIVALYATLVLGIVLFQRKLMLNTVVEQQQLYQVEEALTGANTALAYMHLHVDNAGASGNPRRDTGNLVRDIAAVNARLRGLVDFYPNLGRRIKGLEQAVGALHVRDAPPDLGPVRLEITALISDLEDIERAVNQRSIVLSTSFRRHYDSIAIIPLVMGLMGGLAFAGVVLSFFSTLVRDIRRVQERAELVATGYRGAQLPVTRHDELGALMEAVNRVQGVLREREQRLEMAQERRFHHEKMAAIGSLASAVAHEINNPIAAIAGIAQRMKDGKASRLDGDPEHSHSQPDMILDHTRRIAGITRQLAEHAAPHLLRPQLLDLNTLIRNTCSFVGYDPRFRGIDLVLDLDRGLPAVHAVADHLTQVLMNLLMNAADAVGGIQGRKPSIRVTTHICDGSVVATVSDNGHGMDKATLARVFRDSFTTKPPEVGHGIGLVLCKDLIEENGGRIEIESAPGVGTTARIGLPLRRETVT